MEKMHLRALNLSPPPSETIFSKMLFKTDSRPHWNQVSGTKLNRTTNTKTQLK
jgi:hypothetical protein